MANPPITIGELTDVPAPQSPISAQWAQEVTNRIQHRYASKAALDGWATALVGTHAVTVNDGVVYQRVAAGWARLTPWQYAVVGAGGTWVADR
jgi:hypothetical protein